MSRIFISYRREDSAGEAGRIYDYLERKFGRAAIFKDVDAIAFGDNFRDRIHEAVGQCQILLAIIGRRWLQVQDTAGRRRLNNPADWVRLEIETALQRDVRVIPVLLDGVGMPAVQDLSESLQPLCYRNAARVRHDPDFRTDIERVLRDLEKHLEATERQKVEQTAKKLLDSSLIKQNEGDDQEVIADCDKAIQFNPDDDAEVYYKRGNAKSDLGDKQGAIADYDKAIQINPDYAKAYNNRGVAKRGLGDIKGAITEYDKAIQINPDDADVYYNRGLAKSALSDKQGAISDHDRAIQINSDYAKAYYSRGVSKSGLGDNQGAIADYDKAIQINPDYAKAYNGRGLVKLILGKQQDAVVDYDKAIQINPDYAKAYYNRGVAKRSLGDNQGAIADYDKAIQINSDYADAYNCRGLAKSISGNKKGAIADYKQAMSLSKQQGNTSIYDLAQRNLKRIS